MPKYYNDTSYNVYSSGVSVAAKGTAVSSIYLNNPNLTIVSEHPMYNPIVLSTVVEKSTIIDIPKTDAAGNVITRYQIHFYQENKTSTVYFNSRENKPALILYQGIRWNTRALDRVYNSLIIDVDTDGKVYVIIEKV